MAKKQSGDSTSTLAAKVLKGKKPTKSEILALAGSVLSQDETKGKRKPPGSNRRKPKP